MQEAEGPGGAAGAGVPAGTSEPADGLTRAVRATAVGRGTHGVPELRLLVEGAVHRAFPYRIWVAGRVDDVAAQPEVGLHFVLRASADDEEPFAVACLLPAEALPQVADVLDRVHDADVADVVHEGRLARVGGLLRYDVPRATLVLSVSELDPAPTQRGLAEERDVARAAVVDRGLDRRQRERPYRTAPLVVTVVTAVDDQACDRVLSLLRGSVYAVDVRTLRVPLHGAEAPAAVAGAVREAAMRSDLVLLVRERGRPLTLGVFDRPEVVHAVADALVPVVSALGTDGEQTATDDVAALSLPDGEAAAAWVLDRLGSAEQALRGLATEVEEQAGRAAERARTALDGLTAAVQRTAEEATARADVARRRQVVRVLALAGVLAVVVVAAAVLLGQPLVLLGLLVVGGGLLALRQGSAWSMTRGSRPMSQQDDDFTAVLARLRQLREELAATSSPEAVHRLRETAGQLVARGEQVLHSALPETRSRVSPDAPTQVIARAGSPER